MKFILLILMALSTSAFAQRTQTINADCLRIGLTGTCIEKAEFETLSGASSNLQDQIDGIVTGFENVDNTSDLDKPISTATQSALDLKADALDFSNVDNTSDLDKPISTATQTALDDKANDAEVLHQTGDESASGVKTFTGKLITSSTLNGSLPCPVMTEAQRNAIASPVAGDCVFNSTTNSLNVYNGTLWKAAGGGLSPWETAFSYAVGDIVIESDKIYQAVEAHTSGTFYNDYNIDAKWKIISEGLVSVKGQSDSSTIDVSRLEVPNKQLTAIDGTTALIETGNGNVLPDPGFEGVVFGWVSYKDAAAATPENGIGGTAVSAINFTASSPLRGAKSGLFIKPTTVNSLGEGFSRDFTIDGADKTKIVDISFDYETSANYDGDIRIYIYDVSNSKLIELVNRDLMANANGTYRGFFQASPDSVNYRLIGHVATTKTADYTVKLDNVKVAPQAPKVTGAVETDPVAYTPIIENLGTISSNKTSFYRSGKFLTVDFSFVSGTHSASIAAISLPSGYVIDTDVMPNNYPAGDFSIVTLTGDKRGTVGAYTAAPTKVFLCSKSSNLDGCSLANDWGNGSSFSGSFKVPIKGWSSNMVLSEDDGNREIATKAILSSNFTSTSTSSAQKLPLNTAEYDKTAALDATNNRINIQETGTYDISFSVAFNSVSTSTSVISPTLQVSGVSRIGGTTINGNSVGTQTSTGSATLTLTKGDYVELYIYQNESASETVISTPSHTFLTVAKRFSPQTIAASETVAVRITNTSGQVIPHDTATTITGWTKIEDSHGSFNTATGEYTFGVGGLFDVVGQLLFENSTWAASSSAYLTIQKNGTDFAYGAWSGVDSGGLSGFKDMPLNVNNLRFSKGDIMRIQAYQSSGTSKTLLSNSVWNHLSIKRTGN